MMYIGTDLPNGWQHMIYDTLDSTNTEAKRLVDNWQIKKQIKKDVVVLQSKIQSSGRGRGARTWHSPAGNLHFSVLFLHPRIPYTQFSLAGFFASVAVVEGIIDILPKISHKLYYKWPNDVFCGTHKLCGILSEGQCHGDLPIWLIVGIGINVVWAPDVKNVRHPSTSLVAEGVYVATNLLLSAVCHKLAILLARWQTEGFVPVRKMWLARAIGIGQTVTARWNQKSLSGTFIGLDHDGALLLEKPKGNRQRVLEGDVFFQGLSSTNRVAQVSTAETEEL